MDKQTLETGNELNSQSEGYGLVIARIMGEDISVGDWSLSQWLDPAEVNDVRNYIRNIFQAKKEQADQDFANL